MNTVSDLILKKGPFSPVWIAGTTVDKLGKKMVLATDISTVAKRIMEEERVNLVLRLSGMLLKGLVIVYSKKMQYMLTDCEEIINKIKLSFKPGQIDLQDGGKKNREEALTISASDLTNIIMNQGLEIAKWINTENPEEYFVVAQPQIDFATPEVTPVNTDVSSESSIQSTASSQISAPHEDFGANFSPQTSTILKWKQNEIRPQWEPLPDDDDVNIPMPNMSEDDSPPPQHESEGEAPEEAKKGRLVLDKRTELGEKRRQAPRNRRPPASKPQNQNLLGSNSILNALFEESREISIERNRTKEAMSEPNSDDSIGIPMDDDVEINRAEEPPVNLPSTSDDAEELSRRASAQDSTLGSVRRTSFGSDISPLMLPERKQTELESPFPNLKFAIEQTPRRTAEDSITSDTIKTMNKLRTSLTGPDEVRKDSITFSQAFTGSSRHLAAMSFYQLLVLKSTGTIDLIQNEPFAEINITPVSERFWST